MNWFAYAFAFFVDLTGNLWRGSFFSCAASTSKTIWLSIDCRLSLIMAELCQTLANIQMKKTHTNSTMGMRWKHILTHLLHSKKVQKVTLLLTKNVRLFSLLDSPNGLWYDISKCLRNFNEQSKRAKSCSHIRGKKINRKLYLSNDKSCD